MHRLSGAAGRRAWTAAADVRRRLAGLRRNVGLVVLGTADLLEEIAGLLLPDYRAKRW